MFSNEWDRAVAAAFRTRRPLAPSRLTSLKAFLDQHPEATLPPQVYEQAMARADAELL